jgi:hypothetical protein
VTKLTTVVILLVVIFTSRSIVDFVCVLSDDCSFNLGEYKIHMPTFGNLMVRPNRTLIINKQKINCDIVG